MDAFHNSISCFHSGLQIIIIIIIDTKTYYTAINFTESYYYQDAQSQQRPVKFNVNMGRELSAEAIQQQQPEAEQREYIPLIVMILFTY